MAAAGRALPEVICHDVTAAGPAPRPPSVPPPETLPGPLFAY